MRVGVSHGAGIPDIPREEGSPEAMTKCVTRRSTAISWKPEFALKQCALRRSPDDSDLFWKKREAYLFTWRQFLEQV